MNQLDRIMEVLRLRRSQRICDEVTGRPSSEDVDAIKSPFAATMLESLPMSRPRLSFSHLFEGFLKGFARPLSEMFPSASVEALDLLRLCLQFNPNKRITAKDALRHPYVVQFHNPDDEFDCDRPGTMKRPKSSVNRLSQVVMPGMPLRLLNDFSVREAAEAPFEFPSTTIRSSPSRTSRRGSLDVIYCAGLPRSAVQRGRFGRDWLTT